MPLSRSALLRARTLAVAVGAATVALPAAPALAADVADMADASVGDEYAVEAERVAEAELPDTADVRERVVASVSEVETAAAPGDWLAGDVDVDITHTVEDGDSLGDLAAAYGFDGEDGWRVLFDANPDLDDPARIWPGLELDVPVDGDTLTRRDLPAPPAPEPAETASTTSQPEQAAVERRAEQSSTASRGSSTTSGGRWDALAACESGGNWSINTGNGYYGGLQFSLASWQAVGGSGYPHEASKAEQINRAEMLLAQQGWGAWPACTAKLGWR